MKRVLITGGARRVGAAIAMKCAEAGMEVIIHCLNSIKEAKELIKNLPGTGHEVITADLANPKEVAGIFSRLETVDVLINNASEYHRFAGVQSEDMAQVSRFFQVNAFAPIALMKDFARQTDSGVIINILDQEVMHIVPDGGAYSWSRRTLRDATLEYARAIAPSIRVCGIAPGPVLPPSWAPESRMEKTLPNIPLARPVALDDLTATVMFILKNNSITGEIISVDCGQHLK